jgi:hypothetical protein
LIERLAGASNARVSFGVDDFPDADLTFMEYLAGCGLADPDEPATGVICEGCEQACPMPITFRQEPAGRSKQCFVVCDKRTDIGLVPVDPVRLRRWRLSTEQVAGALAALLKTDGKSECIGGSRSWSLGEFAAGSSRIPVTLAATAEEAAHGFGLRIILDGSNCSTTISGLPADQLLVFRDGLLGIRPDILQRALAGRFGDERIACEIIYVRRDVVLINHTTASQRVLASPNFDSVYDNAFQHLYDHVGQGFTLSQLQKAARAPGLKDLHKIAEALHFDGNLKKLFFRIS